MLNLAEYFHLPEGVHLHIIDAHRPWNLDNLFGLDVDGEGDRIWVWGDGDEVKLDNVKKSWEALEVGLTSVTPADVSLSRQTRNRTTRARTKARTRRRTRTRRKTGTT